jgi:hypothetical protein
VKHVILYEEYLNEGKPNWDAVEKVKEDPEFQAWYGPSKVRWNATTPMTLFHGTTRGAASNIKAHGFSRAKGRFGGDSGIHFMNSLSYAKPYDKGGMVYAFARLTNPMDFDENFEIREKIVKDLLGKTMKEMSTSDWQQYTNDIDREFVKEMRKRGYDGVFDKSQAEVVVYDSNNIWTVRD